MDIRKKFSTIRMVRHWYGLPGKVVDSLFLEMHKVRLDEALSILICCRCPYSLWGICTG